MCQTTKSAVILLLVVASCRPARGFFGFDAILDFVPQWNPFQQFNPFPNGNGPGVQQPRPPLPPPPPPPPPFLLPPRPPNSGPFFIPQLPAVQLPPPGATLWTSGNLHPWMASLFHLGRRICSAVLISEIQLLTAAHCVSNGSHVSEYQVLLGVSTIVGSSISELPAQWYPLIQEVDMFDIHDDYSPRWMYNDLALVVLKRRIVGSIPLKGLDPRVTFEPRPISLPSQPLVYNPLARALMVSMRRHEIQGESRERDAESLSAAGVRVWRDHGACRAAFRPIESAKLPWGITRGLFCVTVPVTCQGDSGGPIELIWGASRSRLFGSFGFSRPPPPLPPSLPPSTVLLGIVSFSHRVHSHRHESPISEELVTSGSVDGDEDGQDESRPMGDCESSSLSPPAVVTDVSHHLRWIHVAMDRTRIQRQYSPLSFN